MLATPELILEAGQAARLTELLPRYQRATPLYQGVGQPLSLPDGADATQKLRHFPFITKHDIRRDFPRNFLGPLADLEALAAHDSIELEHTSGTSEERTALLLPRGWWVEQERRALRLHPLAAEVLAKNPEAHRITIASPVCSSDVCYTSVPARDDRIVGQSLFLSLSRYPFLWSDADLERMAAEAVEWEPQFLDVDPVYGVVFARYCERHGIRLPSLQFILCSYEFLSVVHRRILQRVFGVPVFDLYGSTETGHLLIEDPEGRMQASPETALLEVLEPDATGIGELVVTTLTNDLMPLIRYRIGDLVERFELPYRTRYLLHGRVADSFRTSAGRVTTRQVDLCFEELAGFAHYQLLQRENDSWRLRFVPDATGPSERVTQELRRRLIGLLGAVHGLAIEPTDMLMPENSGKFRLGYPV